MQPIHFPEGTYTDKDIDTFKKTNRIVETRDIFEEQLGEFFEITNPKLSGDSSFQDKQEQYIKQRKQMQACGTWIYFPWKQLFLHTVTEEEYFLLRTNRNQEIIPKDEQALLRNVHIGFVGLSIGGHFVESLAYSGIGNTFLLAEFDAISTTNLNRLHAGVTDVGRDKLSVLLERIYEIDPYVTINAFPRGLDDKTLESFIAAKPDLIFEAIDDFKMKIKLRMAARKAGIPVVMLTNLGDNVLVDIERYDIDSHLPLFNGRIGKTPEDILSADVTRQDLVKFAIQIVGIEHIPNRVLQSLLDIGSSLVGRPQIYSTVALAGGLGAYIARHLLLKHSMQSGRYYFQIHKIFNDQTKNDTDHERNELLRKLNERLGL